MIKKVFYLFVFFLFNITVFSNTDSLFNQANLHYKNNEFEAAIEKYEQILSDGYESSELYFNLGNAYYKIQNIGRSILNYERAKLFDPTNEDIQFNLELANSLIVDKIEEIPPFPIKIWFKRFVQLYSSNAWAIISMLSFIICLAVLLLYFFSKSISIKKISFWTSVLLLFLSISAFSFSNKNKKILTNRNSAIILSPSVTAKSTPDINGSELFVIHEGLKVEIVDILGEWSEIKLSDGNKGWVRISEIERI